MAKSRRPQRVCDSRPDLPIEMVDRQGQMYQTYLQLNGLVESGQDGDEQVQQLAVSLRTMLSRKCRAYEPCDCSPACLTCESSSVGSRKTPARGDVCTRLCWFSTAHAVQNLADPA